MSAVRHDADGRSAGIGADPCAADATCESTNARTSNGRSHREKLRRMARRRRRRRMAQMSPIGVLTLGCVMAAAAVTLFTALFE
jgi:hypothetical protein